MPGVIAKKHESFKELLKRFNKAVEGADIMNEVRKREFFEKPTSKRKRKKAAAIKRWERKRDELNVGDKKR